MTVATLPTISLRSAEASRITKLSAVQQATAASIASKARLDKQKETHRHSRAPSQDETGPSIPTIPPIMDKLVKVAYRAADSLSDTQATSILKQLYGEGFEWGLSTDVDVTSPEEPCSLAEALKSPDAPKWLAACNEELDSIKSMGVF